MKAILEFDLSPGSGEQEDFDAARHSWLLLASIREFSDWLRNQEKHGGKDEIKIEDIRIAWNTATEDIDWIVWR